MSRFTVLKNPLIYKDSNYYEATSKRTRIKL